MWQIPITELSLRKLCLHRDLPLNMFIWHPYEDKNNYIFCYVLPPLLTEVVLGCRKLLSDWAFKTSAWSVGGFLTILFMFSEYIFAKIIWCLHKADSICSKHYFNNLKILLLFKLLFYFAVVWPCFQYQQHLMSSRKVKTKTKQMK